MIERVFREHILAEQFFPKPSQIRKRLGELQESERVRQLNNTSVSAQIRDLQKRKEAGETFYGLADLEQHVKNLGKTKKL